MKGERRHELEKNELADWIAGIVTTIKPYQNAILGVMLLAAVAGAVYAWMSRQSAGESEAAWNKLYEVMVSGAMNPADFDAVAENHPNTTTAHWAIVLAAEVHLARGCDELFNTKVSAREELRKAEKRFRVVLDGGKVLDEGKEFDKCRIDSIRERATFGLAQTSETAGDLEKAMESWSSPALKESGQKADRGYQGVLNLWPAGAYAALAQKRLEDLQRPSTRIFYDDFVKWEPPKSPLADEEGTPGVRPPSDLTVPDDGPVFTPTDPTKPDAGGAKPSGFPQPDLTPDEKPAPVPKEKPAPEPAAKEKPAKPAP